MLERIRKELAKYEDEERIVEEGTDRSYWNFLAYEEAKYLMVYIDKMQAEINCLKENKDASSTK